MPEVITRTLEMLPDGLAVLEVKAGESHKIKILIAVSGHAQCPAAVEAILKAIAEADRVWDEMEATLRKRVGDA